MKKIRLFFYAVTLTSTLTAQQVVTYYNGTPALERKYTDVEGSELLYPDWTQGQIKTTEGKVYAGQKLKYNMVGDQFFFQGNNGVSMAFVTQVAEVQLGDSASSNLRIFRNGYPTILKYTPATYYEVLVDGKLQLLKKVYKYMVETKDYNSPTVKKHFQEDVQYYLHTGSRLTSIKKDKSVIPEAVPGKASAINAYLSSAKPNLKKEEDLVKMVRHLNTL